MNRDQEAACLAQMSLAVAETIEKLKEIPSGELYENLIGVLTLDEYNAIIGVLKNLGMIKVDNYFITWNK